MVGALEELEGFHQQGQVVAVDGAEVLEAELFKQNRGPEQALGGFFSTSRYRECGFAAKALKDAMGLVVQILVMLVGDDLVEVAGDGADVAVDGPLVVIEDNDQPLCLVGDIVERFKGDAVGEGGVSGNGDDMLVAAGEIAGDGHAQGRGEGSAGVTGSVTIVLAFGAQHEAVEAAVR